MEAKADKNEYAPGNVAELTFTAKPYSFIGVMGIDQSVLLLKSGNDITHVGIFNAILWGVDVRPT